MTILLLQTFLLMLGAFLLGASLACFIRRGFSGQVAESAGPGVSPSVAAAAAGVPAQAAKAVDTDRFGRALAGEQGPGVPPVFQGQPVIEVQPLPEAPVAPAPSAAAREPEPLPTPPEGPTYTEIAVAAAAATAAAAAAKSEAEAAARAEEEAAASEAAARAEEEAAAAETLALAEARAIEDARALEEAKALEEARALEEAEALAEAKAAEEALAAQEALAAEEAALAAAEAQAAAEAEAAEEAAKLADAHIATDVQPAEEAAAALDVPEVSELPPVVQISEAVDDLTRIRGIDAELKDRLVRLGVGSFATIAAWTASDVSLISQSLGFQGRIEQENWIAQAQILATGGETDYSRKLEVEAPADATAPIDGERLHRIIGIDPQSEALLRQNGVTTIDQIAGWSKDDVERFEWLLGVGGRISRENWVQQARFLAGFVAAADDAADAFAVSEPETVAEAPVVDEPVEVIEPVAVEAEPEPVALLPEEPADDPVAQDTPKSDYAGLRSVRSEALRGDSELLIGGTGEIEDLKRIRGIGVLIEKKLNSLGITSYEQVANWTEADIDRISQLLDFKGRIERENWIEQARILASGGQTEFSRRADRGEA